MTRVEVLFTPAEFEALKKRDLSQTICVVFDILRATSTMVTALGNGAAAIIPVAEIAEAVEVRRRQPDVLLAGEREGLRISAKLTGGVDFDLGNSPREFTKSLVQGKTIAMSTTNGTKALRACAHAKLVLAGSFLNLRATSEFILRQDSSNLLLVCGGTVDQAAYEDVLGAGGVYAQVSDKYGSGKVADSALMSHQLFLAVESDLLSALSRSRNGRRLLAMPNLGEDVAACAQRDRLPLIAELGRDGFIRKRS